MGIKKSKLKKLSQSKNVSDETEMIQEEPEVETPSRFGRRCPIDLAQFISEEVEEASDDRSYYCIQIRLPGKYEKMYKGISVPLRKSLKEIFTQSLIEMYKQTKGRSAGK